MAETLADVLEEIARIDRRLETLADDKARLAALRVIAARKALRAFRQSVPPDTFLIDDSDRHWMVVRDQLVRLKSRYAYQVPIRADRERDSDARPLRVPAGDVPPCDGTCAACISGGHCADR